MTANDIFKRLLKDPVLKENYEGLTDELLNGTELHSSTDSDVIEIIKLTVQGIEDDMPNRSIYSQIKNHFNL